MRNGWSLGKRVLLARGKGAQDNLPSSPRSFSSKAQRRSAQHEVAPQQGAGGLAVAVGGTGSLTFGRGSPRSEGGGGAWKELTAEWKAHLGLPEPGSISGTFSLPLAHSGHRAAQGGSGCHIPPSQGRAMLPIAPRVSGFTSLLPSRSLSCSLSPLAKTSRRTIGDSPGIFTN